MSPAANEDSTDHLPNPQHSLQQQPLPLTSRGGGKTHLNSENSVEGSGTQYNGTYIDNRNYYLDFRGVDYDMGPDLQARKPVPDMASNSVSPTGESAIDGLRYLPEQEEQDGGSSEQDDNFDEKYDRPFRKLPEAGEIIFALDGVSEPLQNSRTHLTKAKMPNSTLSTKTKIQGRSLSHIKKMYQDIKREISDGSVLRTGGEDPDKDQQCLIELQQKALDAKRKAQDVERRTCHIFLMVQLGRQARARPPRQEVLDLELVHCREDVHKVLESLEEFRSLFQRFCLPSPPDRREAHVLDVLSASRDASGVLCQRLSRICPYHPVHQVYFSANRERNTRAQQNDVSFVFACQRNDSQQVEDNLVWIRAKSAPLTPYAVSEEVGPSVSNNGARFCLAQLPHNFKFMVGESCLSCLASHDVGKRSPMPLSEWIKTKYKDIYARISLARMIAEVVLNLNPTLWRPTCLKATDVFVVSPKYKKIESHIKIRLEQPGDDNTSHDRASTQNWKAPPIEKVLLDLGLTLLELAYCEEIPPATREALVKAPIALNEQAIREKCCRKRLEEKMGTRYADVTRFCLLDSKSEGDMYDLETQKVFYQKVIRPLEIEEEEMGGTVNNELEEVAKDVLSG